MLRLRREEKRCVGQTFALMHLAHPNAEKQSMDLASDNLNNKIWLLIIFRVEQFPQRQVEHQVSVCGREGNCSIRCDVFIFILPNDTAFSNLCPRSFLLARITSVLIAAECVRYQVLQQQKLVNSFEHGLYTGDGLL